MANKQIIPDRLTEALGKSIVDFLNVDLAAAWGSSVDVKLGHPDFNYDKVRDEQGQWQTRDLSVAPLVVIYPMFDGSRPFAMSPKDDVYERLTQFRVNCLADSHFAILSLTGTLQSVLDGADAGTGGIPVSDPDSGAPLGTAYIDTETAISAIFSGPGESVSESTDSPEGKSQFQNFKHRSSIIFTVPIRKTRGSKVI